MTLVAKETGNANFTPPPEGTHAARCCQVIDLGTQHNEQFDTTNHRILIGWELSDVPDDTGDGRKLTWQEYTLSLNEKANLRAHLEAWRGKAFTSQELEGFHLKNILNVPCLVNVKHKVSAKNRTYGVITSVMKPPANIEVPELQSNQVIFDLENPDWEVWDTFSDFLKGKIMQSSEWTHMEREGLIPENVNTSGGTTQAERDRNAANLDDDPNKQEIDEDDIPF